MSKDNMLNEWIRHIDVEYHLNKTILKNGKTRLKYVSSEQNSSDIMTKAYRKKLFAKARNLMRSVAELCVLLGGASCHYG